MSYGRLEAKPECPECHRIVNGFKSVDNIEDRPEPGDHTSCMHCGTVSTFTSDYSLVRTEPRIALAVLQRIIASIDRSDWDA